jgi:hypothetical protein
VAPLSITIEKVVVENITDDPLEIASVGVAFTQASEKNLKNMMQGNRGVQGKNKDLGGRGAIYKEDRTSVQEFMNKC